MYCATVFYHLEIYFLISSSPAALIKYPNGGYYYVPSIRLRGIFAKILRAILWWNPPKIHIMWGVTTHVSDPSSRMA